MEVVLAITILGLVSAPICSSLMVAARINARSRAVMTAQMQVSSAVEYLMAKGIEEAIGPDSKKTIIDPELPGVNVSKWKEERGDAVCTEHKEGVYCKIVVSSEDGLVSVEPIVRVKAGGT